MKKFKINEEQFIPFIEEGLRDIKKNGTWCKMIGKNGKCNVNP